MMTATDYLARLDQFLDDYLLKSNIPASRIKEAIHYALFPAGKRIRPLFVYLSGELLDVNLHCLDAIAGAIELTHSYSLIHDDLPAMDDDDLRRGRLSCHKAFDEATAILAGDGMQAMAFELLLNQLPRYLSADKIIAITRELVKASGVSGMVSGQSLDLTELTNPDISEEQLTFIHKLKTGCLFSACIKMVIHAHDATNEKGRELSTCAEHLGLVFQMQDDYLDCYASEQSGKSRASDLVNHKTTFATLYNQDNLLNLIEKHYHHAHQTLSSFGKKADALHALIHHLQTRHLDN